MDLDASEAAGYEEPVAQAHGGATRSCANKSISFDPILADICPRLVCWDHAMGAIQNSPIFLRAARDSANRMWFITQEAITIPGRTSISFQENKGKGDTRGLSNRTKLFGA